MKSKFLAAALLLVSFAAHASPGDFEIAVRGEFDDVRIGGGTLLAATAPDDAAINTNGRDKNRALRDIATRADQACGLVYSGSRAVTYILDPGTPGPFVTLGFRGTIQSVEPALLQHVYSGPHLVGVPKGFKYLKCSR